MKLTLIRHGMTPGNLERRFVGTQDQPLASQGREGIQALADAKSYPYADYIACSPMTRCLQTAELIYPRRTYQIFPGLREYNFGIFEGKSHEELENNPYYIEWLRTDGASDVPEGESRAEFHRRCREAFLQLVSDAEQRDCEEISVICHGGTIMSLLDQISHPHVDFIYWQLTNGNGFQFDYQDGQANNIRKLREG